MSNFEKLLSLNVNDKKEKKGNFDYLSWAFAWAEFKKIYPDAQYIIKKDSYNNAYFGSLDVGFMVYTEVTAGGLTYEMWLPVMDFKNKAVLKPNMMDINKAIMRCLVKNLAMFGLGLYIYAGEDLPEIQKPDCNYKNNLVAQNAVKKWRKNNVLIDEILTKLSSKYTLSESDKKIISPDVTKEDIDEFKQLVGSENAIGLYCFTKRFHPEHWPDLNSDFEKGSVTTMKKLANSLAHKGAEVFNKTFSEWIKALNNDDPYYKQLESEMPAEAVEMLKTRKEALGL